MEIKKIGEAKSKKSIILWKLAIAVLALMSIGQISAIFIPAFVGVSPGSVSIVASILWPGLLLMSIWSLRNRKKLAGFLLGALTGLILYFAAGFTAGYFQAQERAIDKVVSESNKDLPKMVDEETRLNSVSIDQKLKIYKLNLSLINLMQSEIDLSAVHQAFEKSIKPTTCSNETFSVFFADGYEINYVYKDKSGDVIANFTVNPADCE